MASSSLPAPASVDRRASWRSGRDAVADPPPQLRVEADLDGVRVLLPRRITGSVREHRRLQGAVVLAALAAAALAICAAPAVRAGGHAGLVVAAVFCAGLLPYAVLLLGQQRLTVARVVSLSDALLRVDGWSIPLADIAGLQLDRVQRRGRLLLDTPDGVVAVLDGLLVGELSWLAALIGDHAARRRDRVGEGGEVPGALTALVAQAQRVGD